MLQFNIIKSNAASCFLVLTLLLFCGISTSLKAADPVRLFDANGKQVDDYEKKLEVLREAGNGELVFFKGEQEAFRASIKSWIDCGNTTCIFEVTVPTIMEEGNPRAPKLLALRLPKHVGHFSRQKEKAPLYTDQFNPFYTEFISDYINLSQLYKIGGISVPKMYPVGSIEGQTVLVEKINTPFNLDEAAQQLFGFSGPKNLKVGPIAAELKEIMKRRLMEFAASTYLFSGLSDFGPHQLAWDSSKKSWVLLDFLGHADIASLSNSAEYHNVFKNGTNWYEIFPTDFREQIVKEIDQKRTAKEFCKMRLGKLALLRLAFSRQSSYWQSRQRGFAKEEHSY